MLISRRDDRGDYKPAQIWQMTQEEADELLPAIPTGLQEVISNSAFDFAKSCLWPQGAGSFQTSAALYSAYKEQQEKAGREPLSSYAFSRAMLHSGRCIPHKIGGARGWKSIDALE
jgi:hypothetical protein